MGRRRDRDGDPNRGRPLKVLRISDGDLEMVERPTPEPTADQVLVEVAGSGINRADLQQRAGRYPAPPGAPADVPGLEFSGVVVTTGPGVQHLSAGDRVFGILSGGGHATHVLTTEWLCCRVADRLDLVEAGGVPEAFFTAHDALFSIARLRPGERVLVHGVGSGVGTAAVQLARAAGASTVGTSRSAEKLDRAAELGLDERVLAGEDMVDAIGEVDVVLDLIGGAYLDVDLRVCRTSGRIVVLGLLAGSRTEIHLGRLLRRRIQLTGSVLRARSAQEKAAVTAAFSKESLPLFETGALRPVVDRIAPLEKAADGYQAVADNATFGKVVLTPGD